MNQFKIKITELQVVQRVIDFWNPLAAFDTPVQIQQQDEYDDYGLPLLQLLRANAMEEDITEKLNDIRFGDMGIKRNEFLEADNRFYAWALLQTHKRHLIDKYSNILIAEESIESKKQGYRIVTALQMIQQELQDWDPLKFSRAWLRGADTLNQYDDSAIAILNLIRTGGSHEDVCLLLEKTTWSDSTKLVFCIENGRRERSVPLEAFNKELLQRAPNHAYRASDFFRYANSPGWIYRKTE